VHESLVAHGVEVHVDKPAVEISRNSHTVTGRLESGDELVAEELLAAVGRKRRSRSSATCRSTASGMRPSFPTRSEVWLRLLETYERSQQ